MQNLKQVLDNKTIDDLRYKSDASVGSNLIEPTTDTIEAVITRLLAKENPIKIKKEVIQTGTGGQRGKLSFSQINNIKIEMDKRIKELTVEDEEE